MRLCLPVSDFDRYSLTIARWLTSVYDTASPAENPTTPGDATRPLRGRVATAWSSRSVLRPSRDDDEREEMIMELSLLMQQATDDLRHGRIPRSVYERVWMAVYEETYALAAGDQPSKSQR